MLSPTPSSPGRGRSRWLRRLWGAVTLLAALVTVAGLTDLQAPAASAASAGAASAGAASAGAASAGAASAGAASAGAASAGAASAGAARAAVVPGPAARLKPVVRTAVRNDVSAPLRKLKLLKPVKPGKLKALPLGIPPHALAESNTLRTANVQRGATVTTNTMPPFGQSFEGVSNLNGVFPPDTNMAVGPNDIVQTVNLSLAIYNKSGNTLLGPETLDTLWQGFGGECDPSVDSDANGGDVVSLYDEAANRFVITQLAIPQAEIGSGGYHECIAISQTGDPTGAWYRYDFFFSSTTLNDYPKWGVWPDAYYMSNNDFANGQTPSGVSVTAFDRAQMLAGQQATSVQFTVGAQYSTLLPGNTEGAALGSNPPTGAPNPYFMSCDAANGGPCTSDQLDEWDFHVDWANPGKSTFGNNGTPSLTIPVAAFNSNLCNYNGACIQQPGTSQKLDALSDRLMYQSAYRDLGGTQAIVFNQTVNVSANPVSNPQAGVRWYELTNAGSGWTLAEQGSYAPDSDNRWMGSTNIDASGDIALGYSVSSAVTYPSIRVAGRLAGDPADQLSQGEKTLVAGTGSQTGSDPIGRGRWGDYSVMQVDPTDGCTFWYTQEYIATTSNADWQTRIGSFKFPSCTTGAHGTISGTLTDAATGKPIPGAAIATDTGSSTITDSQGHYTLVLPAGSYNVTFHAFGYTDQTDNAVQVSSGATTTESASLSAIPMVHVTGTVTDGSGQGWQLHASIAITGRPGGPVWTDPGSGQYSVDLPQNATYQLTVTADLPGYQIVNDSVTIGTSDLIHNISVPVDAASCTAPGYQYIYGTPSLSENFDSSTTIPPGWTTTDNNGSGGIWQINDPLGFPNETGGSGNFADIDGEYYGRSAALNVKSTLTTPVLDLSGDQVPIVQFNTEYLAYNGQTADVDVSTDGGQTWTNIWEHTTDYIFGPDQETLAVPQAGGHSAVDFRFHYTTTQNWGGWWEVDNVTVENRACSPIPGGLVVGQVADANTGNGLNNVTVTDTDNSDHVTTRPTGDPTIGNGYYWMFSKLTGSHPFTAVEGAYQAGSQTVNITAGSAAKADFALDAGRLSITPSSIQTSQVLGDTATQTMTIKNTGTAAANVNLVQEGGSAFKVLTAAGAPLRLVTAGPDGGTFPVGWSGNQPGGVGQGVTAGTPADPTWSTIAPYPSNIVDNAADSINGKVYSVGGYDGRANVSTGNVYDPVQNTWSSIASMPQAREKPGAAALDGKLYVSGGWDGTGNPIAETDAYDPSSNSWSTESPNPNPVAAPAVAVANSEIYFVGGCASVNGNCPPSTTVEVYNPRFDSWSTAAPYPQPTSWMSCAGIRGKVYCAGGANNITDATYSNGYVYDPTSNTWSPIASMPIDLWGSAYGAANGLFVVSTGITNGFSTDTNQGYAYDPTTNTWTAIPNAQYTVYRSGGVCGFYKIGGSRPGFPLTPQSESEWLAGLTACGITGFPWMSESTTTATLQPGQSVDVTITLTATPADQATQPGTYTAGIGFEQDTPYPVNPVGVTMNVTPPKGWGKIAGMLSGEDCNQVTAPLRGVVYADGKGQKGYTFTLPTDTSGNYGFWAPAGASPFSITGSATGWIAVSTVASIKGGKTTTVNFTLRPQSC